MDVRKIVAIVEDVEVARTALNWALHHLVRHGDLVTLLHVFPYSKSRSRNKLRLRRLKAFQLALSFKDICSDFPNAKIEIVVREGDQEGGTIAAVVREIGASTLVVGIHNRSFLYNNQRKKLSWRWVSWPNCTVQSDHPTLVVEFKATALIFTMVDRLPMAHSNIASNFNCKVVAIKQPTPPLTTRNTNISSPNILDVSQIEIAAGLSIHDILPPKIPYRICPDPYAIIWRSKKTRRRRRNS